MNHFVVANQKAFCQTNPAANTVIAYVTQVILLAFTYNERMSMMSAYGKSGYMFERQNLCKTRIKESSKRKEIWTGEEEQQFTQIKNRNSRNITNKSVILN